MGRNALIVLIAVILGGAGAACSSEPEHCRFNPECEGGIGAACSVADDCDTGFCCTTGANCRGGMCTSPCRSDDECPEDMLCEHDVCFFRCATNADCASGMSCEHGNTVCEWP